MDWVPLSWNQYSLGISSTACDGNMVSNNRLTFLDSACCLSVDLGKKIGMGDELANAMRVIFVESIVFTPFTETFDA